VSRFEGWVDLAVDALKPWEAKVSRDDIRAAFKGLLTDLRRAVAGDGPGHRPAGALEHFDACDDLGIPVPRAVMRDLELFLIGIIMAATLYCDGEQVLDPDDDFELWRRSWDAVRLAWEASARARGWLAVGQQWEFHS
jgi:hypothetical protein